MQQLHSLIDNYRNEIQDKVALILNFFFIMMITTLILITIIHIVHRMNDTISALEERIKLLICVIIQKILRKTKEFPDTLIKIVTALKTCPGLLSQIIFNNTFL